MNPGLFSETDSLSPRTFASKSARIWPRGPRSAARQIAARDRRLARLEKEVRAEEARRRERERNPRPFDQGRTPASARDGGGRGVLPDPPRRRAEPGRGNGRPWVITTPFYPRHSRLSRRQTSPADRTTR